MGWVFIQWHMVIICIWCALFVTSQFDVIYLCFQSNVLAKVFDKICIFLCIHSPYFICHCAEYKLLAIQVRISEKIYSTLRHSSSLLQKYQVAARVKTGGKTLSSMRQSNFQPQNETALMSCQIRAVEHRRSGWTV